MKPFMTLATMFLVAVGTFSFYGCDKVDQAYDCNAICQKYADCVDSNYDVSSCADTCRSKAADDSTYADKADDCQACIDDKACTETFPCIGECAGIVP